MSRLRPASFTHGLVLVDSEGCPAIVARSWRQHLLGKDEISDREHRLVGMELLVRPDVGSEASKWALAEPVHVTTTVTSRTED